jgi:nucleotide-binding universal stress UspA family protein
VVHLTRTLVAIDFSPASELALEYARTLTSAYGGSLHLLHVVDEPLKEPWIGYSPGAAFLDLIEKHRRTARERMARLLQPDERVRRHVVITGVWGDVAAEILKYARAIDASLIVCGTHGRTGFDRWTLGSVAEAIVRAAPCPVLTVHAVAGPNPTITESEREDVLCAARR